MDLYLFIVVVLFFVAIADLVVGVSNDAVNFLNSAIGSKVASMRTILIVATLGILLGSIFSGGIMEVARKGIFNPQFFTYETIMYLFLAVMLTDIILLDFFNTMGMPTSTTVSIVFELLGAASMAGVLLAIDREEPINTVTKYINGSNALVIISGIFLSIIFAFTLGAIVQFFARWVMSFDYEKNLRKYGALFSGVAITAISYFLIIKGLKGSPFAKSEFYASIKGHTYETIGVLFVFWTVLTFILQLTLRINPLKFVVLAGTFSLAMAFAGNDLVNFIGVPISAFESYKHWVSVGKPANLSMDFLSQKVPVDWNLLFFAGIIMALTLWFSPKARKVTETEVNLGRQIEGDERFRANEVARSIVRTGIFFGKAIESILPQKVQDNISNIFSQNAFRAEIQEKDQPAFDLVRASINLMMASVIIAYATSHHKPLSTTYVSFMVAMGTSLADKAWGRESAVYRVAGVLSVIGGWLLTALIAITGAALLVLIMIELGVWGMVVCLGLALYSLIHSNLKFNSEQKDYKNMMDTLNEQEDSEEFLSKSQKLTVHSLRGINNAYSLSLRALPRENIEMLRLADKQMDQLQIQSHKGRVRAIKSVKKLDTENLEVGNLYIHASDLVQDITQSTKSLTSETLFYVKNLHQQTDENFNSVIQKIAPQVSLFMDTVSDRIDRLDFSDNDEIIQLRIDTRSMINEELDKQIGEIQIESMKTKKAILQTEVLLQSRDILAVTLRLYKLYRDFGD